MIEPLPIFHFITQTFHEPRRAPLRLLPWDAVQGQTIPAPVGKVTGVLVRQAGSGVWSAEPLVRLPRQQVQALLGERFRQ